jgi:hypothetical protein
MSEYCKDFAEKYGMRDDIPELCEGCGKTFERKSIIEIMKGLFN